MFGKSGGGEKKMEKRSGFLCLKSTKSKKWDNFFPQNVRNKNVKVYEKIHAHRLNLKWLIKRSFRLGVLGHYIDTKIYGKILGYNINYIKSFFYLLKAIIYIILIPNKTSRINIINFFLRFIGRLCGPFVFNKINFLKKWVFIKIILI